MVEWLVLEPLAPPAQEGITNRKQKQCRRTIEENYHMLPCPELVEDLPGVELVVRRTSAGWPPIVPLQLAKVTNKYKTIQLLEQFLSEKGNIKHHI